MLTEEMPIMNLFSPKSPGGGTRGNVADNSTVNRIGKCYQILLAISRYIY